eukprot:15058143-Alexandrium_andersonii.AAC.1
MSASLVGSEMCIRDRHTTEHNTRNGTPQSIAHHMAQTQQCVSVFASVSASVFVSVSARRVRKRGVWRIRAPAK